MEKRLKELYSDPENPGGFASVNALYQEIRKEYPLITREKVKKFLENENTYTLHKQRRIHFKRETTVPAGLFTDLQVDLGDFQKLSRYNDGMRYLLLGVDVLSRRVFVQPVKSKTSAHMKEAFDELFKEMPMLPHRIFSDRGLEFESKEMKSYFSEREILKFKATFSVIKAALAERFLRTVKTRLYRYMSNKATMNWVEAVPKIAKALNNSKCRSIGMAPNLVTYENAQSLWEKLYGHLFVNKNMPPRFNKNDAVRLSNVKGIFDKGYLPTFSDRVYRIQNIKRGKPNTYEIIDEDDKKAKGKYYEHEFSKTHLDKDTLYVIEEVFGSRVVNGKKQYSVKFRGFNDRQWIEGEKVV